MVLFHHSLWHFIRNKPSRHWLYDRLYGGLLPLFPHQRTLFPAYTDASTRHSICWLLPAGVYTLLTVPPFLTEFLGDKADFYSQLGYNMATHSLPTCAILLLILVLLAFINRKIIFRYVYEEQFNGEKSKAKTNLHLTFLEHFHDTGEFLKLEVRSIMRNKTSVKRSLWVP